MHTQSERRVNQSVCVWSLHGVTGGFETALIVSLTAQDGTACKKLLPQEYGLSMFRL